MAFKNFIPKHFPFFLLLILTGCQVNYPLMQPWKNKKEQKVNTWQEGKDILKIEYAGENLQPTFYRNGIPQEQNFSIQSYYFDTGNGRKINGWLLKPKNQKSNKSIFGLHGNAGNLATHLENFSVFTEYGFQVFLFDYSGYGFSEGKTTRKNAMEDVKEAFRFFENIDEVKNTSKIIYGQSLGGNFAVPVAAENQQKIEGLVLEGTFLDVDAVANHYIPGVGKLVVKNNFRNAEFIKKFTKPVLIIHSKDDKVVPMKLGKKLYSEFRTDKEFLEINDCHLCGHQKYGKTISDKINMLFLGSQLIN